MAEEQAFQITSAQWIISSLSESSLRNTCTISALPQFIDFRKAFDFFPLWPMAVFERI
ncbi:hypothetical protein DPMN_029044 [Dreissena polymorpha]|uniref:Uncharacterized protein n=1 Tax=Dreissena polymorpha TaxID=45954 RepID=A0A9D4REW7_DREPO|nr:hypothetical protein DPMN_029044 [Dreissena polymorpha]